MPKLVFNFYEMDPWSQNYKLFWDVISISSNKMGQKQQQRFPFVCLNWQVDPQMSMDDQL